MLLSRTGKTDLPVGRSKHAPRLEGAAGFPPGRPQDARSQIIRLVEDRAPPPRRRHRPTRAIVPALRGSSRAQTARNCTADLVGQATALDPSSPLRAPWQRHGRRRGTRRAGPRSWRRAPSLFGTRWLRPSWCDRSHAACQPAAGLDLRGCEELLEGATPRILDGEGVVILGSQHAEQICLASGTPCCSQAPAQRRRDSPREPSRRHAELRAPLDLSAAQAAPTPEDLG